MARISESVFMLSLFLHFFLQGQYCRSRTDNICKQPLQTKQMRLFQSACNERTSFAFDGLLQNKSIFVVDWVKSTFSLKFHMFHFIWFQIPRIYPLKLKGNLVSVTDMKCVFSREDDLE